MNLDLTPVSALYNARFEKQGRAISTVGWGSIEDQFLRFDVLLRDIDVRGKTFLDVGCGLGSLVPYLESRTGGDFKYIGIDVADKLIDDARLRFGGPGRDFYVGELLTLSLPVVDIAVLSGALSFRLKGVQEYAQHVLARMHELSLEWACANFLSSYVDFEIEKNQHYRPEDVFTWARRISRRVNLLHDYPLYEFTVQIGH